MEFERLGDLWRQGAGGAAGREPAADLAAARARAKRLQRVVRRRDIAETATALVLAVVFAWMAFTASATLSRMGAAIIAVAGVFIPLRLWMARRAGADRSLPVREAVARELSRVRRQQRLLASVAWWYLTPLGLGVILFMAGTPVPAGVKVGYAAVVIALYVWILRLNLRAVRRDVEPVARELEAWLANLDDTSSDGATK